MLMMMMFDVFFAVCCVARKAAIKLEFSITADTASNEDKAAIMMGTEEYSLG